MKKVLAFVFAVMTFAAVAQEVPIGTPLVEDCQFFLLDSGTNPGPYGPNENLSTTICQDGTGDGIITLYFPVFVLGTGDEMSFYDGDDASAPLLGTYSGNTLDGENITSTGPCMTVVFTSNSDAEVGNFGAAVSCSLPCDRPVAIITSSETVTNPSLICPNEELTFNGGSSTFAPGTALGSFTWVFGDGTTDNTSWPTVTHTYANPGAYFVQLFLTDDNDCNSGNLPDELIFVATVPEITTSIDDDFVCTGQEVDIIGVATPVTYSALPNANFGGALFIPDDQSACFSSELLFGAFSAGATLTDVNDLLDIYMNFEHSYMGDLVISIICPDGTEVALHQQGGGSTFLGEPIDNDADLNPGVGYDYSWSPSATNGTWEANSGGTLPPGTYESVEPLANLVGCPLNGTWTIQVCDLFGSDNGFIFDWGIDFSPELYPDLISFTPSIGAGCDSTFWGGNFIGTTSPDCDNITVVPTAEGTYTYVYTVYDNHGCTYTESVELEVYPGPIVDAGSDIIFCGDAVEVDGEVLNPVQGVNYVYSWSPATAMTVTNAASSEVDNVQETTDIVFSVYPTTDPQCIVRDTIEAFVPEVPEVFPLDTLDICAGFGLPVQAYFIPLGYQFIWSFAPNLTTDAVVIGNTSEIIPTETGYYYVESIEPICNKSSVTPIYIRMIPCDIKIPDIFTPNGDAENNTFEVTGLLNFPGSTLQVWNRWGQLIYENTDYRNNWAPNDTEASDGVYYFILGINKPGGMEYFEGDLTIKR